MSKTKRVFLTIGIAVLALAAVIGTFLGVYLYLQPPAKTRLDTLNGCYGSYFTEDWKEIYFAKDTAAWPIETGTRYYVYEAEHCNQNLTAILQSTSEEKMSNAYSFWLEDMGKKVSHEYCPDFSQDYSWCALNYHGGVYEDDFTATSRCFALLVYQNGRLCVISRFI